MTTIKWTTVRRAKTVSDLSRAELETIAQGVLDVLYPSGNLDSSWNQDTIGRVADVFDVELLQGHKIAARAARREKKSRSRIAYNAVVRSCNHRDEIERVEVLDVIDGVEVLIGSCCRFCARRAKRASKAA